MKEISYHKVYPFSEYDIKEMFKKMKECLISGQLTNGKYVRKLEEKIKNIYDIDYCIATTNCSLGLFLCYQFFNWLKPIHLPNFTWISVDLITEGLFKLYHDIDLDTWLMKNIPSYGIISPNHTFGNICNIRTKNKEKIIFDGAHALMSKIDFFGDATVFSLAPTKLITSCEGGIIVTNNKELAKFVSERRTKIARMSELHAIVGITTLKYINEIRNKKKEIYNAYSNSIPGKFQYIEKSSNYNTIGFLNTDNLKIPPSIQTKQYYFPLKKEQCPNSWDVYSKMVCLPSWYDVDYSLIIEKILEYNNI